MKHGDTMPYTSFKIAYLNTVILLHLLKKLHTKYFQNKEQNYRWLVFNTVQYYVYSFH